MVKRHFQLFLDKKKVNKKATFVNEGFKASNPPHLPQFQKQDLTLVDLEKQKTLLSDPVKGQQGDGSPEQQSLMKKPNKKSEGEVQEIGS